MAGTALLVLKTQECNIGVRDDGLYTMDTRTKKATTAIHKDVVADIKFPSGSVIIKKKGVRVCIAREHLHNYPPCTRHPCRWVTLALQHIIWPYD